MKFVTTDISIEDPPPEKNCLRGGLNSEKVITSVVLNEFLINLQYRKVCGEWEERKVEWVPASEVGIWFAACV